MSKKNCPLGICTSFIKNGTRKCKLCVAKISSSKSLKLCWIHFQSRSKQSGLEKPISVARTTTKKVDIICPYINVVAAFEKVAKDDTNFLVQLFDLKTQGKKYYKFLQDLGFKDLNKTRKDAFLEKETKIFDNEKKKENTIFTFLHQFTFFQGYQKILVLTWVKQKVSVFLGVSPLVSSIKKREFLRSIQPQECREKCEILTIVCSPENLAFAAQLCKDIFTRTKLDLSVFYFYPFEDGPNNNTFELEIPLLTSYTIYKTLINSGGFQNISKYNKYGILQFTTSEIKSPSSKKVVPYEWFPFKIQSVVKVLGEGNFGCTFLVYLEGYPLTQKAVVKIVTVQSEKKEKDIIRETDIQDLLDTFNLPHIPTFIGAQKYKNLTHLEKSVSLEELEQGCPKIVKQLTETKYPIYSIAMSPAMGGSISTLYKTSDFLLTFEVIQSLMFQALFTLQILEKSIAFVHVDLNENNILFIRTNEKSYWKYEHQNFTWIVPIELILQFIDFGLSITEKSNNPYERAGTSGFMHPDYTVLMDAHPLKWTQDWYALGKHMFYLALKVNISFEILDRVEDNKLLREFFKQKNVNAFIKRHAMMWIGELLFLEMLGFPFEKKDWEQIPIRSSYKKLFFNSEFFNVIQLVSKNMKNFLLDKLKHAKESLGEDGIDLIKELCRWKYSEISALPLLNHAYFKNFSNLNQNTKHTVVKHIIYPQHN